MTTFTLTTGADTIVGTPADDTVEGTAATLNATDSLDGGGGYNTLALFGSGTFDLSSLAQFVNFQEVDVTNITAAQERQKTLAAELSHRVRNSLAVVASIAERSLEPGEAKDRFLGRLHAKARAHDLLSEVDWTDLPLRDVILAQLGPHPVGDGANVTVSGPPVLLKPRTALFLSSVFHELVANAATYGALSVPDGRIEASWVIEGNSPGHLTLTWVERGGPKIARLRKRGFGTELIEKGVPFELQGDAILNVVDGGLQCRISVPAKPDLLTVGSALSGPASQ